jgi:hypothetical protein
MARTSFFRSKTRFFAMIRKNACYIWHITGAVSWEQMRLFSLFGMLILLLLPVFAADPVSDDELFDRVRIRLADDREVGGGNIHVKVSDGVVELSGKVKTEKIKEKAGKIAKKVKGVKKVVNQLTVGPLT